MSVNILLNRLAEGISHTRHVTNTLSAKQHMTMYAVVQIFSVSYHFELCVFLDDIIVCEV